MASCPRWRSPRGLCLHHQGRVQPPSRRPSHPRAVHASGHDREPQSLAFRMLNLCLSSRCRHSCASVLDRSWTRTRSINCWNSIQVSTQRFSPSSCWLMVGTDKLKLQPISTLEKHLADLQSHTMQVSTMLTHLLQTRDALKQDSETYNKLIGELVADAQKRSTAKRVGGGKRSTMS